MSKSENKIEIIKDNDELNMAINDYSKEVGLLVLGKVARSIREGFFVSKPYKVRTHRVVFGSQNLKPVGILEDFGVSATFGDLTLDLRNVVIKRTTRVYAQLHFGNVKIILPEDVPVTVQGNVAFGEISHRYNNPVATLSDEHQLIINYDCNFGEITMV
ncbi:MAG: hypothetical protein BEN19_01240 [Epulopiscium sp. Nuni2H_MBin003]|nr:MAG: hypothetical protein BEN19_01240 [Epulopiscium sp. Nuni2H_MBin003]